MKRFLSIELEKWLKNPDRKPLVLRGARQVGKTWLVRNLAKENNKTLIELNFEKNSGYRKNFSSNEPKEILLSLSVELRKDIDPNNSLLFLDEIQNTPEIISKLRWFKEEMPELAVIATGSLLEFVLSDYPFSMPVGRISYMHLEPLSFEEFILAHENKQLHNYLQNFDIHTDIPSAVHNKAMLLFKEYLLVGGLPEAVLNWVNHRSFIKVQSIQSEILSAYINDFSKYRGRYSEERLEETLAAIPRMLGRKFDFSKVNKLVRAASTNQVLKLLEKAKLATRVRCTHANGVPLGGEIKDGYFKEIFLDVGLCSTALGLDLSKISPIDEIDLINDGAIAEQVVGQLLRTIKPFYQEPALYYWIRAEKNSNAEIDYVLEHKSEVIPVEVKAGATGSLKSLHLFMDIKKYKYAIRINSDVPSITKVNTINSLGNRVKYTLLSIPFYLIGQIHRIMG